MTRVAQPSYIKAPAPPSSLLQNQISKAYVQLAEETKGKVEEKTGQMADTMKDKAYEAAQDARDKTSDAAQAAKEKAQEFKDQTGGYLSDKTAAAKEKIAESTEVTKQKAVEAAQSAGEMAQAGKDKTGGFMQQTGEQVRSMAEGAADAVKHTFGMAGPAGDDKDETH